MLFKFMKESSDSLVKVYKIQDPHTTFILFNFLSEAGKFIFTRLRSRVNENKSRRMTHALKNLLYINSMLYTNLLYKNHRSLIISGNLFIYILISKIMRALSFERTVLIVAEYPYQRN